MMEVEKERKDKLAAARKKLNEYKLNRGKSSPSAASSKPADVPAFYQNLNAPATTFTIFNPAAAVIDNNNGVQATSSYFTSSSPSPSSPSVFPQDGSHTAHLSENMNNVDLISHSVFTPIPQQLPLDNAHDSVGQLHTTSPLSHNMSIVPPSQPSEGTSCTLEAHPLPAEVTYTNAFTSNLMTSATPVLFESTPMMNSGISPVFATEEKPLVTGSAVNNFEQPLTMDVVNILSQDKNTENLSQLENFAEYSPSAPPASNSEYEMAEGTAIRNIFDTNGAQEPNVGESNQLLGNGESTNYAPKEIEKRDDSQSSSVQLFASSLFGLPTAETSEIDQMFNISENMSTSEVQQVDEFIQTQNIQADEVSRAKENLITSIEFSEGRELFSSPNVSSFATPTETIDSPAAPQVDSSTGIAEISDSASLPISDFSTLGTEPSTIFHDDAVLEYSISQESNKDNLLSPEVQCSVSTINPNLYFNQEENKQETFSPAVEVEPFKEDNSSGVINLMKSMQEALELQIEELRRENEHLLGRQCELTSKIEESEKLAHEFKVDRDRVKEEAMTMSQALRAKINSLCEENQRIVKNSTEVGVDLRKDLEDKTRKLEEMEKAVIIVSQSKMEFAGKLDNELERVKEMQKVILEKDEEISSLRSANVELIERLKQEQQKGAIIHQLQDQTRHFQVQNDMLQKDLSLLRRKLRDDTVSEQQGMKSSPVNEDPHQETLEISAEHDHLSSSLEPGRVESGSLHCTDSHEHVHSHEMSGVSDLDHSHSGICDHDHHDHGDDQHHHNHHQHDQHHHHDHDDSHNHHHNHDSDLDHDHHHHTEAVETVARRGPTNEVTELKKTLHRLEWENSSFRNEIDILAVSAKQKRTFEEKCEVLEEENARLKKEIEQLEHVVIQLQGENDTIGDYITLYQTQKLALKECAKEKDAQLELLAREREMLLHRLAELTALVKELKDSKSEAGSQCADDHVHSLESHFPAVPNSANKRQIEGKIRDLLTEISSSTLIENFHPCALCSGRLMTV